MDFGEMFPGLVVDEETQNPKDSKKAEQSGSQPNINSSNTESNQSVSEGEMITNPSETMLSANQTSQVPSRRANRVKVSAPKYESASAEKEASSEEVDSDCYRVSVNLSQDLWAALSYRILRDKISKGRSANNASIFIRNMLKKELALELQAIKNLGDDANKK